MSAILTILQAIAAVLPSLLEEIPVAIEVFQALKASARGEDGAQDRLDAALAKAIAQHKSKDAAAALKAELDALRKP